MNRLIAISLVLFVAATPSSGAEPDQKTTIPLDQIWGYHLPGTRDIAGIPLPKPKGIGQTEASFRVQRERFIEQMRRALASKPSTEKALPGFVLPRHADFYTLRSANTLAAGMMQYGRERREFSSDTFRADDELTLAFFSHPASYYVRLKDVEREGNEIIVHYQFEPHATVESTVHFALIPLGKLPAGEYHVCYEQIPLDQKHRDAGFEPVWQEDAYLVSRPFSFEVWEPTDPEPLEGATLIPLDQIWAYEMRGTLDVKKLDIVTMEAGWKRCPTIEAIRASLKTTKRPKEGENAGPGFVVEGTGKEALKKAAAVLTEKEQAPCVHADTDLSLVFYSYSCGQFVHIVSVEQSEKQIRVKYQFVGHPTTNMTSHFALIPLGQLPEGEVEVIIEQAPSIDQFGKEQPPFRNLERLVCNSFTFEVHK